MKELHYYGGQGYCFSNENGIFEVRANEKKYHFSKLSEAKLFYESLNVEKAIWDLSYIAELIECHYYEKENDDYKNLTKQSDKKVSKPKKHKP